MSDVVNDVRLIGLRRTVLFPWASGNGAPKGYFDARVAAPGNKLEQGWAGLTLQKCLDRPTGRTSCLFNLPVGIHAFSISQLRELL